VGSGADQAAAADDDGTAAASDDDHGTAAADEDNNGTAADGDHRTAAGDDDHGAIDLIEQRQPDQDVVAVTEVADDVGLQHQAGLDLGHRLAE
jgi:hypothetical protein